MEHTDLSRLDLPEERTKLNREQGGYSFYAYLSRMRYISRWGLMRNSCPENIQEHSHMVAVLAHALGLISRDIYGNTYISPETCATVALFHDAPEIITGDMPTPVKYYSPEIRQAYQKVEDVAVEQLLSMLPPDLRPAYDEAITIPDPHVRDLVKAADKLSAYLKCLEELKAGNTEFRKAKEQTYAALLQNPLPALRCFMEEFLPGFELTLDELS